MRFFKNKSMGAFLVGKSSIFYWFTRFTSLLKQSLPVLVMAHVMIKCLYISRACTKYRLA